MTKTAIVIAIEVKKFRGKKTYVLYKFVIRSYYSIHERQYIIPAFYVNIIIIYIIIYNKQTLIIPKLSFRKLIRIRSPTVRADLVCFKNNYNFTPCMWSRKRNSFDRGTMSNVRCILYIRVL